MKKIFFTLLIAILFTQAMISQNRLERDKYHPAGSRWVSLNKKYELVMQPDGYLVENKLTPYGKLKIWQFPVDGKGTPGDYVGFITCYECNNGNDMFHFFVGHTGDEGRWYYPDMVGHNFLLSNWSSDFGRAGFLELENSGNMRITVESNTNGSIWNSSKDGPGYRIKPVPYLTENKNIVFPYKIKDDNHTVYFAMDKISLLDNCRVSQSEAPLTVTAKNCIEMLPGFETAITRNGAFIAKPLLVKTTATAKNKQAKQVANAQKQIVDDSRFALYPNPTTGTVNIMLDSGDSIKTILLFDVTGKLISQYPKALTFAMDEMPVGIYIYKVETEKATYSGKIIKQ